MVISSNIQRKQRTTALLALLIMSQSPSPAAVVLDEKERRAFRNAIVELMEAGVDFTDSFLEGTPETKVLELILGHELDYPSSDSEPPAKKPRIEVDARQSVWTALQELAIEKVNSEELTIEFLYEVKSLACDKTTDPHANECWKTLDEAVDRLGNESEIMQDLGNTLESAVEDGIRLQIPCMKELRDVIQAARSAA